MEKNKREEEELGKLKVRTKKCVCWIDAPLNTTATDRNAAAAASVPANNNGSVATPTNCTRPYVVSSPCIFNLWHARWVLPN